MTESSTFDRANAVANAIRERCDCAPKMAVVLGSGLGTFVEQIEGGIKIPYSEIAGFPTSAVKGHAGNLVFGKVGGHDVVAMQGRVHYYENGDMQRVTLPTRILRLLGAEVLFVTNSAGAIREELEPGTLMLIRDHLNLMGSSPLIGENDDRFGPRFPDMSEAYDIGLCDLVKGAARDLGIALSEGIYAAYHGPAYETPAEVRMARILGADVVGMSTVPEVLVAHHMGMRCVGISCISNMAAGISKEKLNHQDVVKTAATVSERFVSLMAESVKRILEG